MAVHETLDNLSKRVPSFTRIRQLPVSVAVKYPIFFAPVQKDIWKDYLGVEYCQ